MKLFGYNPNHYTVSGAELYGDISVQTGNIDFSVTGISWYSGPNENIRPWFIASSYPSGSRPRFSAPATNTESDLIELLKRNFGQTFTNGTNAINWLNANGYYSTLTITWTGAVSIDWNTTGNWDANVVPRNTDNVIIPNVANKPIVNQSFATPATCNNLTIQTGSVLTIATGKAMTVSGTITNNAGVTGLIIKSDATGDASFIGPATTASVERYVIANSWIYLSSTVSAAKSGVYSSAYLQFYIESTNSFGPLITDTNVALIPGIGHSVFSPSARTFSYTGTTNSGATLLLLKTNEGNNLVGNPFTSAIDWNSPSWNKTNISPTIWIWNNTAGQYATYNSNTHIGTNGGSNYLSMGQGFIVAALETGITFNISSSVRLHNTTQLIKTDMIDFNFLKIRASGNGYSDEMIIIKIADALSDIDYQYDAKKMMGLEFAPQLYTIKSQINMSTASFNIIDVDTEIPVCIKVGVDGEYDINFFNNLNLSGLNILLRDNKLMNIINLTAQSVVTFTASTLDDSNRFTLLFNSQ